MIANDLAARARRSLFTVGIIGPPSLIAMFLIWRRAAELPLAPWAITFSLHVVLPALLLAYRRAPVWVSFAAGMAILGSMLTAVTITNAVVVEGGSRPGAYLMFKLVILFVALIAPPALRFTVPMLLLSAAVPIAQYFSWPPLLQGRVGPIEPWGTIATTVFALALLIRRAHAAMMENRMFAARAEAQSLERLAQAFLAVRDLANSPLQTIQSATDLLHAGFPDRKLLEERIYGALSRLHELNELLKSYESKVDWIKHAESFDAHQLLQGPAAPRTE